MKCEVPVRKVRLVRHLITVTLEACGNCHGCCGRLVFIKTSN